MSTTSEGKFLRSTLAYLAQLNLSRFKEDIYPEDRFEPPYVMERWTAKEKDLHRWIWALDEERYNKLIQCVKKHAKKIDREDRENN